MLLKGLKIAYWMAAKTINYQMKRSLPNRKFTPDMSRGSVLAHKLNSTKRVTRRMSSRTSVCRGSLIVLEGCDRSGKTTQCNLLLKQLTEAGHDVKLMKFPDRTTVIGHMINDYLCCKKDVEDHAVHLLFSANRWERTPMMLEALKNGTTLIVDRYAYSGVAFTAAKPGFSIDWCKQPDIGLPQPDTVLYLTLSNDAAARRAGFGEERYEKTEFQEKVAQNFNKLMDEHWKVIDADKSVDNLQEELLDICTATIQESRKKPISKLWTTKKD